MKRLWRILLIGGSGTELQASATPTEFTASIKSEYARWAKVIDAAGPRLSA